MNGHTIIPLLQACAGCFSNLFSNLLFEPRFKLLSIFILSLMPRH
jgi:hypothetical protein